MNISISFFFYVNISFLGNNKADENHLHNNKAVSEYFFFKYDIFTDLTVVLLLRKNMQTFSKVVFYLKMIPISVEDRHYRSHLI